jgi:hypothetical protein
MISSRALVFELLEILEDKDEEMNMDDASSADLSTLQVTESSPLVANGSGSDESFNRNSMSGNLSAGVGNKRSYPPNDNPSDGEDNGGPPRKKPDREQDPFNLDIPTSKGRCKRIPCTQSDCLGTDEEMSLLLRSLISHHKIIICPGCCTRLAVKAEEKPEEVWKLHKAEQCERRCIGRICSGVGDDIVVPHRRTTKCLPWRALDDEEKWTFIYTLANPGQQPPTPEISEGVGLRHSSKRIPRQSNKQPSRARGAEIVEALSKRIEEKDRRIVELENGLKAANDRNSQLQQQCDDQHSDQEYLIWTLLERLTDNNMSIPGSIQARLRSHCPGLMSKPEIISMLNLNQVLLPTPSATPGTSQQQVAKDSVDMDKDLNLDSFNNYDGCVNPYDLDPWAGPSCAAGTGS